MPTPPSLASVLPTAFEAFTQVSTGTLATILRQKGVHRAWMQGPAPLRRGQARMAGPAFTVRFVPAREDITTAESLSQPNSFRHAIETMPPGCVLVADAMGIMGGGVSGDILCARMKVLKVAGLVTDGAIRDSAAIDALGFPTWAQGATAPPSLAALHFADSQVVVACGGVAVCPGDIVVADDDGAIVIPQAMASEVLAAAIEKDAFEAWVFSQVAAGAQLDGLYPPSPATKARYAAETR